MGGSSNKTLNLKLKVWKQKGPNDKGSFMDYNANNISVDISLLHQQEAE